MMKKYAFVLAATALAVGVLISCQNKGEKTEEAGGEEESTEIVNAVSIYQNVPVREEPNPKSTYISGINLGETVTYLGEAVTDSVSDKDYYKIRLSDGTEGWGRSYGLLLDAELAAVNDGTPVYKRPDLLTATKDKLVRMDLVAITETKDNWVKIVGYKKNPKGWIDKNFITKTKEDIAFAALLKKEGVFDSNGEIDVEKANTFLVDNPFKTSSFVEYLEQLIYEVEMETMPEEGYYEEDYYEEGDGGEGDGD